MALLFSTSGVRPDTKAPISPHPVAELSVDASFSAPVVQPDMAQVIFIQVHDEAGLPISGAIPYVTAHLLDNKRVFKLPATDVSGISKSVIPIDDYPGQTIPFDVEVRHSNRVGHTRTSIISWW